jgi:hypothetical protein
VTQAVARHRGTLLAILVGLPLTMVALTLFAAASSNDLSALTAGPAPSETSEPVPSTFSPTSATDSSATDSSAADDLAAATTLGEPEAGGEALDGEAEPAEPGASPTDLPETGLDGELAPTTDLPAGTTTPEGFDEPILSPSTTGDPSTTTPSANDTTRTDNVGAAVDATREADEPAPLDEVDLPDPTTGTVPEVDSETEEEASLMERLAGVERWGSAAVGGLVLVLLVVAVRSLFRSRGHDEDGDAGTVADGDDPANTPVESVAQAARVGALDRLRRELEQEPNPRQAIRKAYAVVEGGFGNPELARRRSESSSGYLRRTLGAVEGSEQLLGELTALFMLARYSNHPISEDMRLSAIDAVVGLRSRYRLAEVVPA